MSQNSRVTIVSRETLLLSDGRRGYSLDDLESQGELMKKHREVLKQLAPVSEEAALSFLANLGVTKPLRIRADKVDNVFSNIRSAAKSGPNEGEAVFLSLHNSLASKDAVYVQHTNTSEWKTGLVVCKLPDGSFLCYNDGRLGQKLGI